MSVDFRRIDEVGITLSGKLTIPNLNYTIKRLLVTTEMAVEI